MAEAIIGGVNYKSNQNTATPYIDIYNQYAAQQNKIREAYQKQLDANKANNESKTNASYDNTAKQNYLQYMQNKKQLPGQLNSLGVNGGATESSLIRLGTNYGNNLATNEAGRSSSLSTIGQTYADKKASYDEDFNNKLQQAYLTQLENQRKYEQEQREKDLQYFANSISGRYSSASGYQSLINSLASSSDPNRNYKIALAQQAMNALASSSGSSGSGYSRGYSRSYSSGGSGSSGSSVTATTPSRKKSGGSSKNGSSSGKISKAKARSQYTYGTTKYYKRFL